METDFFAHRVHLHRLAHNIVSGDLTEKELRFIESYKSDPINNRLMDCHIELHQIIAKTKREQYFDTSDNFIEFWARGVDYLGKKTMMAPLRLIPTINVDISSTQLNDLYKESVLEFINANSDEQMVLMTMLCLSHPLIGFFLSRRFMRTICTESLSANAQYIVIGLLQTFDEFHSPSITENDYQF